MDGLKLTDVFQFILELIALGSVGYWGWTQHEGPTRLLLTLGLPILVAVFWGVFRVPNDPTNALVPIPALLRLILEMGVFALAAVCLFAAGLQDPAIALAVIVLVQYVVSGRFVFLLTHS